MDYGLLPPEVNSGLMYTGPGPGPMLAAAATWHAVAAELESAASGYSSVVSGLTGQAWSGPSSLMMVAAATPYVGWLHTTAAAAQQTATQAYGAAAAYEAAFAATVPPPVIAANRAQLATLVATNFFGQNTPAIMATEAQYMAMWAQDATAMYGYAAASQAASTLTAYTQPPRTTNPAGQADQARAVAQTAGNATAARTQSVMQMASTNATHQLASTNAASQQASATNATAHTASSVGTVTPVEPGQTVNVASGSILNIGGYSQISINSGVVTTTSPEAYVNAAPSVILEPGTQFGLSTSAVIQGTETVLSGGSIYTAPLTGPVTLIPDAAAGQMSLAGFLNSGSITVVGSTSTATLTINGSNAATAIVGAGGASITNVAGTLTVTTVAPTPIAPTTSGGLVAASSAAGVSSSPGLAGTAAIQPQLNAPLLAEWAHGLSGAEVAADLAGAPS